MSQALVAEYSDIEKHKLFGVYGDVICFVGWVLVVGIPGGLSPTALHLSPTFSPHSLLLGVLNSFSRCVRPLCHCWCPSISTGHVHF